MNRHRESDQEGYVTKRALQWRTIFNSVFATVTALFLVWAVGTFIKKERIETDFANRLVYAEEQAIKIPKIEIDVAEIKKDISYLRNGQKDQSEDLNELKQDMKSGFSEIKMLIQSK